MKKLKIGMISRFLPEKDGIAIYAENLIKNLDAEVIRIGGGKYPVSLKSSSLKKKVAEIIKKEGIQVLHIQHVASLYSKALNYNLLSLLSLPVPKVITLHEVHMDAKNVRDKVLSWIEKSLARKAAIIVHSKKQKQFLMEKTGKQSIARIYHGIEEKEFIYKAGKNLLFFGMISRLKGVDYLLKAMPTLKEFRLMIAGRPIDESVRKELLERIRQANNVSFDFSWISEENKEKYYHDANIVILPYLWGPYQSGILHNAVSYGRPVVVTDVGSLPELVKEFSLGEVIRPRDEKAIADAVMKITSDYGRYLKGIQEYRKQANWKNVAQHHMELYKRLV